MSRQPAIPRNMRRKQRAPKSQTPGRQKGLNCQATPLERYMAKRSRSYKDKRYAEWSAIMDGGKPQRKIS